MKILGPVLTLGIGAVVAGAIALANANLTGGTPAAASAGLGAAVTATIDARTDAVPPANTVAPATTTAALALAPAPAVTTPPPAPAIDWSYAGKVSDPVLSMALRIVGDRAAVYMCDGGAYELWLYGTATDGVLTLTGEQGQTLTGGFDADHAWGAIDGGWASWTFDVPRKAWPDWAGSIAPGSFAS